MLDPTLIQGVGAAVLFLLLLTAVMTLRAHVGRMNAAFEELARRRPGRARTHAFLFPEADVSADGTNAKVSGAWASQYSSNYVDVEMEPPAPWTGRLTAHPLGHVLGVIALFEGKPLRTGDARFDEVFRVFILGAPWVLKILIVFVLKIFKKIFSQPVCQSIGLRLSGRIGLTQEGH